ncbi:MAG: ferritin-like domain-containing protein [Sandaracinaceae bacterium]|nr:ferritin-like domain-containing protein [Sandaracinaceae bacterium]
MNLNVERRLRKSFMRRLVSTPRGREHVLSLMVAAEEGDESGVFDALATRADDEELQKLVRLHQEDERVHAQLYRDCLTRIGLRFVTVPDELMIIRRIGRAAGGVFAEGVESGTSEPLRTRADVMNTYALLLAIEQRGVQQFPVIGAEFRRLGDHETADVFDRVAKDEARHVRYCKAIGRRYAEDDAQWAHAVETFARIEDRAFKAVGVTTIAHALETGLLSDSRLAKGLGRAMRALDHQLAVA